MFEKTQNLSRRSFLAGAGVLTAGIAGGALVGCSPKETEPKAGETEPAAASGPAAESTQVDAIWSIPELGEPKETIQADVCIVGAGGTGTAAAIQAIDLGLKPVVIERLNGYGGSFIGTEGMTGLETHFTEADGGVTFTSAYNPNAPYGVKNAINTCLNFHHWIPQHKLYENFFGQTAETIDWLESHGIEFEGNISIGVGPKVWHVYDKGDNASPGGYFMQCFGKEADKLGVEARFNTFGRKIVMENGKVAGLLAETDKGDVIKVEAPVVIVGTGGYANNSDMLYSVSETKNANIQALGMDCRDGDGLKMAKDAGAEFAEGLGTVMWCGPVTIGAVTATWTTDAYSAGVQPTLWLNEKGERFCKEDLWLDDFAGAGICVRNQEKTFALFTEADMKRWETDGPDGQVFSFGTPGTPLAKAREVLEKAEGCHVGDSIEAVCKEVGLDAAAVQATLDQYNGYCDAAAGLDGDDPSADAEFGKRAKYLHKMDAGPYWLCETADGFYTTCGGIKVNEKIQVLDADGQVIPGLYAGGSDAGGLYGDSYDVKFAPGSQAAWAVNSGRLAVKDAKEYLGK
ncbi:FAD-binding protein [Gordonibacter massiliensis (ex Traore et al. 2017)]|uniref:FAD-binding protein n=1 Tax=Gordonibacter massiliensis (ex Traore et al. 2017) TaxID=1841863 RepID=A0A842JCA9_9ACTN|nr:FAD-binding protein [Gordonibacter massiliensis (ex Traore et al. 2017)]MBC2889104.1 FAD-binding protein [Gordonibacter massiliensis (ex Traore et al. 2017)]